MLAGCAGRRLQDGVYRSEHGFRVTVPGPGWRVVDGSRAELELRRADGEAGMLAHPTCRPQAVPRGFGPPGRAPFLPFPPPPTPPAPPTHPPPPPPPPPP